MLCKSGQLHQTGSWPLTTRNEAQLSGMSNCIPTNMTYNTDLSTCTDVDAVEEEVITYGEGGRQYRSYWVWLWPDYQLTPGVIIMVALN